MTCFPSFFDSPPTWPPTSSLDGKIVNGSGRTRKRRCSECEFIPIQPDSPCPSTESVSACSSPTTSSTRPDQSTPVLGIVAEIADLAFQTRGNEELKLIFQEFRRNRFVIVKETDALAHRIYLVLENTILAKGTFAIIVKTETMTGGINLIVKEPRRDRTPEQITCAIKDMKKEVAILEKLSAGGPHDGIPPLPLGIFEDKRTGIVSVVMQEFEGNLCDNLSNLPPEMILSGIRQIFRGVGHLTAQGLIHPDIKEQNICYYKDGQGDFRMCIIDYSGSEFVTERTPDSTLPTTTYQCVPKAEFKMFANFHAGKNGAQDFDIPDMLPAPESWEKRMAAMDDYQKTGEKIMVFQLAASAFSMITNESAYNMDEVGMFPDLSNMNFNKRTMDAVEKIGGVKGVELGRLLIAMLNPNPEMRPAIGKCLTDIETIYLIAHKG